MIIRMLICANIFFLVCLFILIQSVGLVIIISGRNLNEASNQSRRTRTKYTLEKIPKIQTIESNFVFFMI